MDTSTLVGVHIRVKISASRPLDLNLPERGQFEYPTVRAKAMCSAREFWKPSSVAKLYSNIRAVCLHWQKPVLARSPARDFNQRQHLRAFRCRATGERRMPRDVAFLPIGKVIGK